jgi:FkbM family methyltransferase
VSLQRIGNLYAFAFGWPALARVHRALFYMASRGLGLLNYTSDRISGEGLAIDRCLPGVANPVVFDVGANEGDWIRAVLQRRPLAVVHAFEPQAALTARQPTFAGDVRLHTVAVGAEAGTLALYDYATHAGSQHASLLPGVIETVHGAQTRSTNVPVITLDTYCAENAVERIDLLKIDVEGFELNVLRGARRLLDDRRIGAIQFEFNEMNVVGRTFMDDFMARLSPTHSLHRVLPHGLLPLERHRHWPNEQFVYQNIVALERRPS